MARKIYISLPVSNLDVSVSFYKALGFEQELRLSDEGGACMMWSESIYVMLITLARWRTFTDRPLPAPGTAKSMLSLEMESRAAVDAANAAAAGHGGQADVNPVDDQGFMYTRDLADPDGHMWAALWMSPNGPQSSD